MQIILEYSKKCFSVDVSVLDAFEYLITTTKKYYCIYFMCIYVHFPVGYYFAVILFEENGVGFNFEQTDLFCIPH